MDPRAQKPIVKIPLRTSTCWEELTAKYRLLLWAEGKDISKRDMGKPPSNRLI